MTDRSAAQQANALVTKYVKLYKEKHGKSPSMNRYREVWGFRDMIADLGYEDANLVIEYYLSLTKFHETQELFRSYDELHKNRLADEDDKRRVAQLHEETAKRVKEWMERNGK